MSSFFIAVKQIRYQFGQSIVIVLLITLLLTVSLISALLFDYFKNSFGREASRVEAVLGSKGSPIQLVLSSVHHSDFPTGNISLGKSIGLVKSSVIKSAIPIALGDSYKGFRIVGSLPAFAPYVYDAQLMNGKLAKEPFEVNIGHSVAEQTKLKPGSYFYSSHGMGKEGHTHDSKPLKVVGIWQKNYSPLDQLLVTPLKTIWQVHEHHEHEHKHEDEQEHNQEQEQEHGEREDYTKSEWESYLKTNTYDDSALENDITSWLIFFKNPFSQFEFLRKINMETSFLAVSPVAEINKVFIWLGLGTQVVQFFTYLIAGIVFLSIGALFFLLSQKRRYDMALLQMIGKSKWYISQIWLWEITLLIFLGLILSVIASYFATAALLKTELLPYAQPFSWKVDSMYVPLGLGILGIFLLSFIPLLHSWKIPIASTLSRLVIILCFLFGAATYSRAQTNEQKKEHWKTWQSLVSIRFEVRTYNGEEIYWPVASEKLQQLHKTEITIRGYLILQYADFKHYEFFLSKVPESQCFFCGGSGPETLLMVTAKKEIKPTYKPVSLKGILYINTSDPEEPLYWLKDAELIN